MRLSILTLCVAFSTSFATIPEAVPTSSVPAAAAEAGKDVVHQLNNAFAKVFETVAPGVVIIETSKKSEISESSPLDDLFFQGPPDENNPRRNPGTPRSVQTEGSGFIVRPDGYIFTNVHVIEDADKIDVKLQDGREFAARVIGADEKTDIAVIKVDAKDLPVVPLGDSDPTFELGFIVTTHNPWGIGVAKDRPLLRDELDRALARVIADGRHRKAWDQWLPTLEYPF